ncbi:putative aminotransferase-like, plant mobile domain-containing protein [Medicago truncatula]|uniref:Putative aminotransferase-like, plant mobile domain-containing protein n=1 Tax=Medicago truncatula TaxID=3880 RepID=A0A396GZD2_MEDTR|nr:putative aminotransferase-like, plant mobile domain-containing protein [Medicago truncatula]
MLLGYTLFAGKNIKTISLLWMLAIRDLANIGTWSWDAMGLDFLYEQLNLTSESNVGSVGGYMSLLVGWVIAHFRHVVPDTSTCVCEFIMTLLFRLSTKKKKKKRYLCLKFDVVVTSDNFLNTLFYHLFSILK